jgi:hypothetical protein
MPDVPPRPFSDLARIPGGGGMPGGIVGVIVADTDMVANEFLRVGSTMLCLLGLM